MPIEIAAKQVDGVQYKITHFGGVKALEVIARVGVGLSLKDLRPEDITWVGAELAKVTQVGIVDTAGDHRTTWVPLEGCFDDHFRGRPASMMKWLLAAFEVQFGPLGGVGPGILGWLKERLGSISPKTATGGSGDSSPPTG